jgi:hypothetical protein
MISAIQDMDISAGKDEVLSFKHWAETNEERPEVMAGQHRIEALKEYIKRTGAGPDDFWWVCEFYDKGAYLYLLSR